MVYDNGNGRAMVCFSSMGRQATPIGNYMAGSQNGSSITGILLWAGAV